MEPTATAPAYNPTEYRSEDRRLQGLTGKGYLMPKGLGECLLVESHEETGGEYVEMELTFPPGALAPVPHRHPTQAEKYEVLEGAFEAATSTSSSRSSTALQAPTGSRA